MLDDDLQSHVYDNPSRIFVFAFDQADLDAGSQLAMPVTVVQQDWGAKLGYDAAGVWKAWAPDLDHRLTRAGHFMAEEAPDEIAAAIRDLLAR